MTETDAKKTEFDHPEFWFSRGIGSDWDLPCLVTGKIEQGRMGPNASGFVRSEEAGKRVVDLFGGRARLDYRAHEPDWIQVKVGVSIGFEDVLERLCAASIFYRGMIDAQMIAWAIDPEGRRDIGGPGWVPPGIEAMEKAKTLQARVDELEKAARTFLHAVGHDKVSRMDQGAKDMRRSKSVAKPKSEGAVHA